jgi:hypothetical protein
VFPLLVYERSLMNRKVNPRVAAAAVAGLAVAGGGAAVAATHYASPKQENQAVVNDAAKQLGIPPAKLSDALEKALENRVDAEVAAGRLTKAQGDALKQRIESGDVPLFAGPGPGDRGFHHGGPGLGAAASYLGVTEAQLDTQLRAGKTLADVARTKSKAVRGLVDAMVADLKQHLDSEVKEGHLTQAQETAMLAGARSRITDFVNGKAPPFRGSDHDGGFGFLLTGVAARGNRPGKTTRTGSQGSSRSTAVTSDDEGESEDFGIAPSTAQPQAQTNVS